MYPVIEVPTGAGYQMWETCTEGSPISPSFATPEELARWLADNGASAFADHTASFDDWLGMIVGGGFFLSMVICDGVCKSGVVAIAEFNKKAITAEEAAK